MSSVGIYIINLDRATARWDFIKKNVEELGLPVHRVSAVDGKTLSEEFIKQHVDSETYRNRFKMYPERGTIGCSLSHEKVWQEFLESDYEFALVFEDDVEFNSQDLKNCIEKAIEKSDLWDILSFEIFHGGCPVKICDLGYKNNFLAVYLTNVTHAGCYLINRKAVKRFLKQFYPITIPVDHYIPAGWMFDLKFLGVEPRIVYQTFGDSQIKTLDTVKFNDILTKTHNAIYNIKRAITHFCYNLKVYLSHKWK